MNFDYTFFFQNLCCKNKLKKLHLKLKNVRGIQKENMCFENTEGKLYNLSFSRHCEKKKKKGKKKDSRNLGKIDENPVKQQISLPGSLNITMLKKKIKQKEQNVHQAR